MYYNITIYCICDTHTHTQVPADHVLHNNLCSSMAAVGDAMLEGEILYRKAQLSGGENGRGIGEGGVTVGCCGETAVSDSGDKGDKGDKGAQYEEAFQCLAKAVRLSDELVYDEPWYSVCSVAPCVH